MRLLLCLSLLCLGSAAFAADWTDLLRRGNMTELERQGGRAGATGLALALAAEERPQRLAALHALRRAEDSWALLGVLAITAADPDRSLAVVAAQVAAQQTHALDAFTIEQEEIPDQDLLGWQRAWLALASERKRWVDIRVYALEVAAGLHERISRSKRTPIPWRTFFADPDNEIRSAAIQLAPKSKALDAQATEFVESDASEFVALAAAQRLCGPLGQRKTAPQSEIDAAVWTRLRALAENKALDITARVDLANCLALDKSPESKRALAALMQQTTPALRKLIVALIQTAGK